MEPTRRDVSVGYTVLTDPAGQAVNEDACAAFRVSDAAVIAIADGVGGQAMGEVASRIVLDAARDYLTKGDLAASTGPVLLRGAMDAAQQALRGFIDETPRAHSARSTLVIALVTRDKAWIAHVGDSRAYRARGRKIERLTRDDTLVQTLVDLGQIDSVAARTHSKSNVLMQSMGDPKDLDYHISDAIDVQVGDALVLSSDGLTDVVDDDEILEQVASGTSHSMADALLECALARKAQDNVSVGVVLWRKRPRASRRRAARRISPFAVAVGLSVFVLLLALIVGVARKRNGARRGEPASPDRSTEPAPR